MLLHTVYTVITPDNKPLGFILPLTISLDADTHAWLVEHEGGIQLLLDRKVDYTKLKVLKKDNYSKEMPDDTHQPIPTLRLANDEAPEHILSQDFIRALTLAVSRCTSRNPS